MSRRRVADAGQWLAPLVLLIITVAAYSNSLDGVFLFDDVGGIVDNALIRTLWPPWAPLAHTTRPVTAFSLALNYAFGGLNVRGYHLFNVAVHLLAGFALFGIARRTLANDRLRERYGGASRPLALAIAAIWLAHPLQTESVTFIIQRAESLMGLFFLLTLYCGIRYCEGAAARGWGIAAITACAFGMATKEVMVAAPIVMWLYDRLFWSKGVGETFRRHAMLHCGLATTWLVLGASLANNWGLDQASLVSGLTPFTYALTQFQVIVHYLRLSIWPHPLVLDYGWPVAETLSAVLLPGLVVAALLTGTVLAFRKHPWTGFWGAWFFLILAPTSSIMPIADIAFEHRMYLPLAGVVAIFVVGVHALFRLVGGRLNLRPNAVHATELILLIAVVSALGLTTVRRNDDYRSEYAMYGDTLAKRPANPRAESNFGLAMYKQGKLEEAMAHYLASLKLKPDYYEVEYNLGSTLQHMGKIDEAIAHYRAALAIHPNHAQARNNLGSALTSQNRLDEAVAHLNESLRLRPAYPEAENNLGAALYRQGKLEAAIDHYQKAMRLGLNNAGVQYNIGAALLDLGRYNEATAYLKEAVRLDPNYTRAHHALASALHKQGNVADASVEYDKVLRLDPTSADAQYRLATLLQGRGRSDEAIARYREALKIDPNHAEAHNNLGATLYSQGKVDEAIAQYREAIRLKPDYAGAQYNLGSALIDQGRNAEAAAHLNAALQLTPDDAAIHNSLAIALFGQGKIDDAIAHFASAVRLNPNLAEARDNLRKAEASRSRSGNPR